MNKEFDCVEMKKRCKNIAKKISWIKLREELKFWRGRIKGRTENVKKKKKKTAKSITSR